MSTIKFLKTREVKTPSRANSTDAGIDFYVPIFGSEFKKDLLEKNEFLERTDVSYTIGDGTLSVRKLFTFKEENNDNFYFELRQQERALIPSGIKCKMEGNNKALIAFNKSGVASKLGLTVGAAVVDESYTGEIHISLINTSNEVVKIYENQKIVQFIELPIYTSDVEIVNSEEELYEGKTTERGTGGFGHTDNK